jgi:hypothetical protein
MAEVDEGGVQLTGEGGFLPELVKRVLDAGLQAELTSLEKSGGACQVFCVRQLAQVGLIRSG